MSTYVDALYYHVPQIREAFRSSNNLKGVFYNLRENPRMNKYSEIVLYNKFMVMAEKWNPENIEPVEGIGMDHLNYINKLFINHCVNAFDFDDEPALYMNDKYNEPNEMEKKTQKAYDLWIKTKRHRKYNVNPRPVCKDDDGLYESRDYIIYSNPIYRDVKK